MDGIDEIIADGKFDLMAEDVLLGMIGEKEPAVRHMEDCSG